MTATTKASVSSGEVSILKLEEEVAHFGILGTSPLICNRMSEKARLELLAPSGRKNASEKASSLKHDPYAEFRASPYRTTGADAPTVLGVLPTMFKKAMGTAALDMPGAKKTQIGRLVTVDWDVMPVYGTPYLFMAVTRSADINKTPDIRTRAILPQWACVLKVRFQKPSLRLQSVSNLLAAAGRVAGIGDWRQEKGSGSYGAFEIVSNDDPRFLQVLTMGREVQQQALDTPQPYNEETAEMLQWFNVETKRRGFKVAA